MIKRYVTVEDISQETPKAEIERKAKQYRRRLELGLIEGHYDIVDAKAPKLNKPFSKYYETIQDYIVDREKTNNFIANNKEIPSELYNRLLETNKEVKEAYGELPI